MLENVKELGNEIKVSIALLLASMIVVAVGTYFLTRSFADIEAVKIELEELERDVEYNRERSDKKDARIEDLIHKKHYK